MKEEDELLKKYGTQNPFTVPEGYFENFSKKLMDKLPEKEYTPTATATITTWQRIKPWVYMAAMFCGLMFTVRVVSKTLLFLQPQRQSNSPTNILKLY